MGNTSGYYYCYCCCCCCYCCCCYNYYYYYFIDHHYYHRHNYHQLVSGAVIVVHLDNDIAIPGTTMTGTVYLEVFKDSISADYLDVQFNGKEFSKVVYDANNNYSKYDEYTFFNVSCNLFTFPNGKYSLQ